MALDREMFLVQVEGSSKPAAVRGEMVYECVPEDDQVEGLAPCCSEGNLGDATLYLMLSQGPTAVPVLALVSAFSPRLRVPLGCTVLFHLDNTHSGRL